MEKAQFRSSLERLLALYEHRCVRFLEMTEDVLSAFEGELKKSEVWQIETEKRLCEHEKSRREALRREAALLMESTLGVVDIPEEYKNEAYVQVRFDPEKTFGELQIRLATHAAAKKGFLGGLLGKKKDTEAEKLYGKLCAWAIPDKVDDASHMNVERIGQSHAARLETMRNEMMAHYHAVAAHFLDTLTDAAENGGNDGVVRLCEDLEIQNGEYDIINRTDIKQDYEVNKNGDGIYVAYKSETGSVRFVATSAPVYVVPMFPYRKDELEAVFEGSCSDFVVSDEKGNISFEGRKDGHSGIKYIYPVKAFHGNVVVFPPANIAKFMEENFGDSSSGDIRYTVDEWGLKIESLGGHEYSDIIVAIDQNDTISDIHEIDSYPDMAVKLYHAGKKDSVIPLGGGVKNISVLCIEGSSVARVFHINDVYSGEKIAVRYTTDYQKSGTVGNFRMKFTVAPGSGLDYFRAKELPPVTVRVGDPAPMKKDAGRPACEFDAVQLTREDNGSYTAEVACPVTEAVDPKHDKFTVFFRTDNKIFQLTKS